MAECLSAIHKCLSAISQNRKIQISKKFQIRQQKQRRHQQSIKDQQQQQQRRQ
jgi:hypothetical protein